jgi:aspartate/methionine/tyrosine aminotransferase
MIPEVNPLRTAARMRDIAPFHVMEVQERALALEAQGRHIVHMEIGQPDFGAPAAVVQAGVEALRTQALGYTSALGLRALREAISRFYAERFAADVSAERICITTGGSAAQLIVLTALAGPQDELLVPDPGYPCTRHMARMVEARPCALPVDASSAYQPTAAQVAQAWTTHTRGVLLASPANPTGTTLAPAELSGIVEVARRRGGFVMVDEIYQGLAYGEKPATALSLGEDVIVVNSFSKYFCMTGWRLGWIVAPPGLMRHAETLSQNLYVSPPAPAQYAALAAFTPEAMEELERRRAEFERRRDFLLPELEGLGFSIRAKPTGAFYVYAGCERFSGDSSAFCLDLLEEGGVATTPGKDFGTHEADRHVRFAYTRSIEELEEGVRRLRRYLR